ncbi:P-loop containing nucleoside triphosphate hydrolase protein [Xylaria telfairii]|nr:P-loop containing nucleoside triphosphate hydrolase protein [Xylaria telfairii]
MESPMACPLNGDDRLGPRVDPICRGFDFTLLFEDVFFSAVTAGLLLLLMPVRIRLSHQSPVKMASYKLAAWKLCLLGLIFIFRLLFLVFRLRAQELYTRASLASAVLELAATVAASIYSFLQDQRSRSPSDILVLYFSTSALTSLPRLRSLWLISTHPMPAIMWTIVWVGLATSVVVESLQKTKLLHPVYSSVTAEKSMGFWGRSFFIWVLPFFRAGYSEALNISQFPMLDSELTAQSAWKRLESAWVKSKGRYRLIRATSRAYLWLLISPILPRIALSAFTFSQPFLIETTVSLLEKKHDAVDPNFGAALIGAFLLVYLGIAISRAVYWRQTYRCIATIRSGLISILYRHTLSLQESDVKDSAVITLMGTDVERIAQTLRLFHELWASALEVAIGAWLLTRQLGVASVVPLIVCIISVLSALQIGVLSAPAQRLWNQCVEKRIAMTTKMLAHMRVVKLLEFTDLMGSMVSQLRSIELKTSERFRTLLVCQILAGNIPTSLAPFATFVTYTVIMATRNDGGLLVSQAFASLSLISLLTNPLIYVCQSVPSLFQAIACLGRIEHYLMKPAASAQSQVASKIHDTTHDVQLPELQPATLGDSLVSWYQADFSWPSTADKIVLHKLSLTIRPGLIAIIGPIASGKSSLLASIVGETTLRSGNMTIPASGIAYCPQEPWIMNDTMRHNIVAGRPFDEKWYEYTIKCCGLAQDVKNMSAGDQTITGNRGSSLSGGQKQRLALARAVYSRLPLVVLDDPMSGFDAQTHNRVSRSLFGRDGHFRRAGQSVVLVTSRPEILTLMDFVIVLREGKVVEEGPYDTIQSKYAKPLRRRNIDIATDIHALNEQVEGDQDAVLNIRDPKLVCTTAQELNLQRQNGSLSIYTYYLQSAGKPLLILWLGGTITGAVLVNFTTIWIQKWTERNEVNPNQRLSYYLGVYALLVVLGTAGVAAECWFFIRGIINNTARKLHEDLLNSVLKAPYQFLVQQDVGTLTNRFSQDMDLIDMTLPSQAIQFTSGAASCIVQLIIIAVYGKYLAAVIPALAVALLFVQRYYLRTSRQVRLIDIERKAPLYKQFIETILGLPVIRSFHWEIDFISKLETLLDHSQRPFYMLFCIQQWLSLVLDLIVGALAVLLVTIAISSPSISAGATGVALVLVLEFNSLLSQTIQAWTKLETSIGAVARVREFVQSTPAEPQDHGLPPVSWPSQGTVQFHQVYAAYSSGDPPILVNVSLDVASGTKLAICGTSGSGKSSLILALLQMMNLQQGKIEIDGTDISALVGIEIRSRINVVSQDAFFIPGTIRRNLDPRGQSSDQLIEISLQKVGLWEKASATGGIDGELNTFKWSQGEKQLLSLARALLVPSPILIMDEATSSVDAQTEEMMQCIIEKEFAKKTVISVLHKLKYIRQFDRVAVIDHGRIIEHDTPEVLLGRESTLSRLYHAQM